MGEPQHWPQRYAPQSSAVGGASTPVGTWRTGANQRGHVPRPLLRLPDRPEATPRLLCLPLGRKPSCLPCTATSRARGPAASRMHSEPQEAGLALGLDPVPAGVSVCWGVRAKPRYCPPAQAGSACCARGGGPRDNELGSAGGQEPTPLLPGKRGPLGLDAPSVPLQGPRLHDSANRPTIIEQ